MKNHIWPESKDKLSKIGKAVGSVVVGSIGLIGVGLLISKGWSDIHKDK